MSSMSLHPLFTELQRQTDQAQQQLAQANAHITRLTTQINQLQYVDPEIAECVAKYIDLSTSGLNETQKYACACVKFIAAWQNEKTEKTRSAKVLSQQLREATHSLKHDKSTIKTLVEAQRVLNIQNDVSEEKIEYLQTQLGHSQSHLSNLQDDFHVVCQERSSLHAELEALKQQGSDICKEYETASTALRKDNQILKETVQVADHDRDQLLLQIEQMTVMEVENSRMISALEEELICQKEKSSSNIREIQKEHDEAIQLLHADLGCAHVRLEAHQDKTKQMIETYEYEKTQTMNRYHSSMQDFAIQKSQLHTVIQQINELHIDRSIGDSSEILSIITKLCQERSQLNESITQLEGENQLLSQEAKRKDTNIDVVQKMLEEIEELRQNGKKMISMKKKLEESNILRKAASAEVASIKLSMEECRERENRAQAALNSKNDVQQKQKQQIQLLEGTVAELRSKIMNLELKVRSYQSTVQCKESVMKDLKFKMSSTELQLQEIQDQQTNESKWKQLYEDGKKEHNRKERASRIAIEKLKKELCDLKTVMDEESLIRGKTIDNIQKQSAKWKRATCQLIAEIQEMSNEENILYRANSADLLDM